MLNTVYIYTETLQVIHMSNVYECINYIKKVIYTNMYGNHFYKGVYLKR